MRVAFAFALALASCVSVADEYRCGPGPDCVLDGVAGRCESTGHCSLPDASCGDGGHRYHASAGQQAGICVFAPAAVIETPLLDLKASPDTVQSSCAADGARDMLFELTLMNAQAISIEAVGPQPGAAVLLSLRDGACPGGLAEVAGCREPMCPDGYNALAARLPPGPYCLVVEEADPAADLGTFALRIREGGRDAEVIDRQAPSPPQSTCPPAAAPDPRPTTCAPTSNDFGAGAVLFMACPGTRLRATVTPDIADGLDVALSLRDGGPIGDELGPCKNISAGTGPEMIDTVLMGPTWLIVARVDGPMCGGYSISHLFGP